MKRKRTMQGLLLAVVLLLAGYIGLGVWNDRQEETQKEEEEAGKVYITQDEQITSLSYSDGDQSMAFSKEDGTWICDGDTEIVLSQTAIETIADTVGNLEAVRELEDPDDPEDYGLTDPLYTIWFGDGDETSALYIGNGAGENYYAAMGEMKQIYTVSSDLISALEFDMSALVENDSVPSIGSSNLVKVTVEENGEETVYEEEDDLAQLAGGFGVLTLEDPVNYHASEEELAAYGLDQSSRITAVASYTDSESEETKKFTVYIGAENGTDDNGENLRYIMVDGSRMVYQVRSAVIENMTVVSEEEAQDSDS